ncbi:hypothetical protein [Kineococcus gypseus]|uniref:hypothetical protein n=1 Tax=Kineococcus gypseus TaxID=1637102 RepID=UPI003D7DC462
MSGAVVSALSGWLGVLLLVGAVGCAVAADALRQGTSPSGGTATARPAVRRCTRAALALTVAAAAAVVVRFLDVLVL